MERKGWTDEELEIMKAYYPSEGIGVKRMLPGRSDSQIYGVAWHYGIKNEKRKKRNGNVYPSRRYTREEIDYIKNHYKEDGVESIAEKLDRTTSAIRSMACKLGVYDGDKPRQKPWSEKEKKIILEWFPKEGIKVRSRLKDRSDASIYSEADHLGVAIKKRTKKSSNSMWTSEEDEIIKNHYIKDGVDECLKLLPGRSRQALIIRANRKFGIKKSNRDKNE